MRSGGVSVLEAGFASDAIARGIVMPGARDPGESDRARVARAVRAGGAAPDDAAVVPGVAPLGEAVELGAISDRSVRVWLRMPDVARVAVRLEVEDGPQVVVDATAGPDTDWTAAVELALPESHPDRPFAVTVGPPLGRTLHGRLAPPQGAPASFTFAFGSCNLAFRERRGRVMPARAAGIYDAMADDLERTDARFALWIGDQVYADGCDALSVDALVAPHDGTAVDDGRLLAAYRFITRCYLGVPGFAALRRRFPSLCMWDDHEILDDWGAHVVDGDHDRARLRAASRAYAEYQHARNPGGAAAAAPPFAWRFAYGDCAFVGLDMRGRRDLGRRQALGEEQWRELEGWLAGEEAEQVATLFVVVVMPVAHAARWFVRALEHLPVRIASAVRDRWCSSYFTGERDRLLGALRAWRARRPERQVVLLSGDVHAASAFTIRERDGGGLIHQLTSSALASPIGAVARVLSRIATRGGSLLEPEHEIERHFQCFANNYGLVHVRPRPGGGHAVRFVVRAFDPRRQELRTAGAVEIGPADAVALATDRDTYLFNE